MKTIITIEKDIFFSFMIGKGWISIDIPFLSIYVEVKK